MELTHFDENGKAVMVDVTDKAETVREATAAERLRSAAGYMTRLRQERSEKEMCLVLQLLPGLWEQSGPQN